MVRLHNSEPQVDGMAEADQSAAKLEYSPEYKYWAFISYSHQDEKWAAWLHKGLETYRVPRSLVGGKQRDFPVPPRIFPVFRDREELPTSADLSQQINQALRQSRYLIVICSPRSATSMWVNEEIKYFKALGRENRVLAVIVDGEPNASDKPDSPLPECFPEALRFRIGSDGAATGERTEPIAADARENKDGKDNAKLKLIAGVLGVNFDALKQRERQRRRRHLAIGISLASLLFLVISTLGAISFIKWQESARRLVEANHNLGLVFNEKAAITARAKKWNESRLFSLLALARLAPGRDQLERTQAESRLVDQPHFPIQEEPRLPAASTVAFSPDGRVLAAGSKDGLVRLWDLANHQLLATLDGHGAQIESVDFSPDGRLLASGSKDKTVRLWDVAARQSLASFTGHGDTVSSVAFSPDGRVLASGSWDKTVRLWDVANRQLRDTLTGQEEIILSVAFSPDGRLLATGSKDKTIRLWEWATHRTLATLTGQEDVVWKVAFSPDGRLLASVSFEAGNICLWNVNRLRTSYKPDPSELTGITAGCELLATLHGHTSHIWSLAFSPDGRFLASGSRDRTVCLWEVASRQLLTVLTGYRDGVKSVAFSPDGRLLATGSGDESLRLWDVSAPRMVATLSGRKQDAQEGSFPPFGESVAFSPDGQLLASTSGDKTIHLWSGSTCQLLASFTGHDKSVWMVAFSPDGRLLASASEDATVKLWDVASRQVIASLSVPAGIISGVAWSPDGRVLALAAADKTVRLWDVPGRQPLAALTGHDGGVDGVAFSPDGRLLASSSNDKTLRLWDVASRQVLATVAGYETLGAVVPGAALAISPDGRLLAFASTDQAVGLWDLANRRVLPPLAGHLGWVNCVAFSPDSRLLASGSDDKTIRFWDAASRQPLAVVAGKDAQIESLAFSPDGRTLASAAADKTIRLWDLASLSDRRPFSERVTEAEGQYHLHLVGLDLTPPQGSGHFRAVTFRFLNSLRSGGHVPDVFLPEQGGIYPGIGSNLGPCESGNMGLRLIPSCGHRGNKM